MDGKLPISYSYYFGSYIIRALARQDEDIAAKLHSMMPYKPYHFSRLLAKPVRVENGILTFRRGTPATIYIASIEKDVMLAIMDALLSYGQIRVWKRIYTVEGVEPVNYPPPKFEFTTLSPVHVSITRDGKKEALSPDNPVFHEELVQNILRKYSTFFGKPFGGKITITYNSIRPRMRYVKRTPIPAYDMDGTIAGDEDIVRLIWDVGLGEKNALGFGMVGTCTHT